MTYAIITTQQPDNEDARHWFHRGTLVEVEGPADSYGHVTVTAAYEVHATWDAIPCSRIRQHVDMWALHVINARLGRFLANVLHRLPSPRHRIALCRALLSLARR